ncbi:helix-turn-helix domain-containing protein [Streptococcus himalayensis]|uniref:Transcriptional regulator n=1 Tax=Streptococcus himalayensis TaxID=1888195 RepID=A0A917AA19_9STRE|nr:helix-turn-helix transcriptional regulator [Streptococcus himalayensis]QBX08375.1 putative transcriptional regulator [Streptococcus satellite phage Javan256]GGE36851.1 transcriptional regulator [Streptococcus himalayensis]
MLITEEMAERVRVKRAIDRITAKALAEKLGITHVTLAKVENGDYDAPRRIYQSVMEWLTEDL